MGLAEHQKLLARLFTDHAFRRDHLADPVGLRDRLGPAHTDIPRLVAEVSDFATSLVHKRRGEVEKLLPLTRQAIGGDRFAALFLAFARAFVPSGVKKHRQDALAFAGVLLQAAAHQESWVRDLIRLEASMLAATDPGCRLMVRRFRHTMADLAASAATGAPPPTRRTVVVWCRTHSLGRLHVHVFSLSITRLWTRLGASS